MTISVPPRSTPPPGGPRKWFITGASGLFGHILAEALVAVNRSVTAVRMDHPVNIAGVKEAVADITDEKAISRLIAEDGADIVVHAAGLTSVDECQRNPQLAHRVHVDGTRNVARAAAGAGARLVYISTDHLWDGTQSLVDEETPPYPINVYAETKLAGEEIALQADDTTLSIRTNFFGRGRPWRRSFSDWILDQLNEGTPLNMFTDVFFTPIALDYLTKHLIALVDKGSTGILHVAGGERLSKYDFAVKLATAAGYDADAIRRASLGTVGLLAPRPHDMSLATGRAAAILECPMPSADDSIATLFTVAEATVGAARKH